MKYLFLTLSFLYSVNIAAQNNEYLVEKNKSHKGMILSLAFSTDGSLLASSSDQKELHITTTTDWKTPDKHSNYFSINSIMFTGKKELLIASGSDLLYITTDNKKLGMYTGSPNHIATFDFSIKNNLLVAGSYTKQVRFWDSETQELFHTLEGHEKNAQAVAISQKTPVAASADVEGTIIVWDLNTLSMKHKIERHKKQVYNIIFHPNGKYLLSCSADYNLWLWDTETGNSLKLYTGHIKQVLQACFTADGEHFFSASADGTIRLWQTRTGKTIHSFVDHKGAVTCLAFDTNNAHLATGGQEGTVLVYNVGKKIFVQNTSPEAYSNFKNSNPVFNDRNKDEDKDAYEQRTIKASRMEQEWLNKQYQAYINNLKSVPYTE